MTKQMDDFNEQILKMKQLFDSKLKEMNEEKQELVFEGKRKDHTISEIQKEKDEEIKELKESLEADLSKLHRENVQL